MRVRARDARRGPVRAIAFAALAMAMSFDARGGDGSAPEATCEVTVTRLSGYMRDVQFADRGSDGLSNDIVDAIIRGRCCSAAPILVAAVLEHETDPSTDADFWLRALSALDCPGTGDGLLPVLDDIVACRAGWPAWNIASALGATGSVRAHERIVALWQSSTTTDCEGEVAIWPTDIARGVTMTGDVRALPWLVSAFDASEGGSPSVRPLAGTLLALGRLPREDREELLPGLFARMRNRAVARKLADECVREGILAKSPFAGGAEMPENSGLPELELGQARDTEEVQWLLAALDHGETLELSSQLPNLACGLRDLPQEFREHELPCLLARMDDRAAARALANECIAIGVFEASPFPPEAPERSDDLAIVAADEVGEDKP